MHYILKLLIILFIQFSAVTAMESDQETDIQRITRELYSVFNSNHYTFLHPSEEGGAPSSLPQEIFQPKEAGGPSFYSRVGILPADAIERLRNPKNGEINNIDCLIATSICKYALCIHTLGGDEQFNRFSQNVSVIKEALDCKYSSREFIQEVVLGNRAEEDKKLSIDLLFKVSLIDTLDPQKLSPGDIISIGNDSLYYDRHPYGKFGAENVIFYGLNESREPLFYGFKGIFEDGQPHTLKEIQIAMLEDFLKEPAVSELYYRFFSPLSAAKNSDIAKRISSILKLGVAFVASNICKPRRHGTILTEKIERIKIMNEMSL